MALAVVAAGGVGWTAGETVVGAAPTPTMALAGGPVGGPCGYSNTFGAPRPGGRTHLGVDIIANEGVPLLAVNDGVISKVVLDSPGHGGGNYLRLKIADGSYYSYLHLQAFADGIAVGTPVTTGQIIGYVGMTGAAPVPHLHFEAHPGGGDAIDPTPLVVAAGSCGPPYDQGTPKPKPAPRITATPVIPLERAVREGSFSTAPPTVATPVATPNSGTASADPAVTVVPEVVPLPPAPVSVVETTPPTVPVVTAAPGSGADGGAVVFAPPTEIPANNVVGATVVGFPGLPASARSVTLAFTVVSAADGRGAVWPCGQRAGLDGGIQLQPMVAGVEAVSIVTMAPGDRGRVCFVGTTPFRVRIAVLSLS